MIKKFSRLLTTVNARIAGPGEGRLASWTIVARSSARAIVPYITAAIMIHC